MLRQVEDARECPQARRDGFTLIELMVAIAIVAILSAIAIPMLLSARQSGNEASAIGSLKTLTSANTQYRARFGEFAPDIAELQNTGYIDEVLGAAPHEKSGYGFTYTLVNALSEWEVVALPVNGAGQRGFFVDASGVIRFTPDGAAPDVSSDPLD